MDLNRNIEELDLVFLDLETTGLDVVTGDSICEIGALKARERKVVGEFHSLINPEKSMPAAAYRIHGISDEELSSAPRFEEVAEKLLVFLKGCVICAYNVEFDMGFIRKHLEKTGCADLDFTAVDILAMARDALKLPRYNLSTTARSFDINIDNMHRALADARATYEVFLRLADIFKEKGIVKLGEFVSLYGLEDDKSKSKENEKIALFKEAIDRNSTLKIRFFSPEAVLEEKTVMPLKILQENRNFYLWYQSPGVQSQRVRLNRILDIEV